MKLATFRTAERISYGIVRDDGIVDLGRRIGNDYPDLKSLLATDLPAAVRDLAGAAPDHAFADVSLLQPIPDPAHIWCLALNYVEHHDEVQSAGRVQELPPQPALFMRWADSLAAHGATLRHPGVSEQLDYEGELVVVIGKPGFAIAEADAMTHVAGYTVMNEGSVRDWQFHTRQITPGKNFWRSGAVGPWIVTRDEVPDPYALNIRTIVNGQVLQDGSTADMVHKIGRFIAYASTIVPLRTGDLLATGTPGGVGFSRKPPIWLKVGDTCEVSISGIGTLRNVVAAE
jgi:2-keto-4-pentenoate hydratase/2-oxohepta-3-ene-1,7-dioic acid hydratase in catechol pathway